MLTEQSGNDRHDQTLAKQLAERKVALEEKLASHARSKGHDQASAEQLEERKLTAKKKAQAMAQKRKRNGDSDAASDSSDDSSSFDSSDSDSAEEETEVKSTCANDEAPGVAKSKAFKKQRMQATKQQRKPKKESDG